MNTASTPRDSFVARKTGSRLITKAMAVVLLVGVGFWPTLVSGPIANAAGAQLVAFDQELIRLVNVKRSEAGLATVQEGRGLTQLSIFWSSQMADGATGNRLEHNPNAFQQVLNYGASARTTWGENVAKWSPVSVSAQSIFDAYWSSPGHKANILGPAFRFVGMGSVTGGNGTSYNTMTFTDQVDAGQAIDPVASHNPIGRFDSVTKVASTAVVRGWGLDPDLLSSPVQAHIYDYRPDGSVATFAITANTSRGDIANAYPGAGNNHGYEFTIPLSVRGSHNVCVYLINVGAGNSNPKIGCKAVEVGQPFGSFDSAVTGAGTVTVRGWAIDPAAPTTSNRIHIYDEDPAGRIGYSVAADQARSDVANAYPGTGNAHGFGSTLPISTEGNHRICAFSIAVTAGANTSLGCKDLSISLLRGALDGVTVAGGNITVRGWAFDSGNERSAMTIHVYVSNGSASVGYGGNTANMSRADVGAAYGVGSTHGYQISVPAGGSGQKTVCAYAIGTRATSGNLTLGCSTVTAG